MDDLGLLLEELQDVRPKWYNLGLELKVSVQTLVRRGQVFWSHDPRAEFQEMLETWLTTSDNTSWKTLSDALRCQEVGENRLAGSLERKYCLTEDLRESKH